MEKDTPSSVAYISHSKHFMKCHFFIEQCIMDYNENHQKSETHVNNNNKPNNIWKKSDIRKDVINNSSWYKRTKIHEAKMMNEKRLPFLPMLLFSYLFE